jgi:hypothetical protein
MPKLRYFRINIIYAGNPIQGIDNWGPLPSELQLILDKRARLWPALTHIFRSHLVHRIIMEHEGKGNILPYRHDEDVWYQPFSTPKCLEPSDSQVLKRFRKDIVSH